MIHWLIYVKAFAVGGLICVVGQLLLQYYQADQLENIGIIRGVRRGADRDWACISRWWTSPARARRCR